MVAVALGWSDTITVEHSRGERANAPWQLSLAGLDRPSERTNETLRRYDLERRFRALGVRLEQGRWLAHPDAVDGPVPARTTFLSPFDRLIHDRARAEAL